MPIPSHIDEFVNQDLDKDALELFVMEHHNRSEKGLCGNYSDFINGFTLAISYVNRAQFPQEDHKWLRIKTSLVLGNIFHKLVS